MSKSSKQRAACILAFKSAPGVNPVTIASGRTERRLAAKALKKQAKKAASVALVEDEVIYGW